MIGIALNKTIDLAAKILEIIYKIIIFLAIFMPHSVAWWLPNLLN